MSKAQDLSAIIILEGPNVNSMQETPPRGPILAAVPSQTNVPWLLRATSIVLFVLPANMVIEPLGAVGYAPLLLALAVFVFWLASAVFGSHDPVRFRHPGRIAATVLLLVSCFSYAALALGMTGGTTVEGQASADRWLILIIASLAITLSTTETVHNLNDAMVLARALLAGAFFCCVVAIIQFVLHVNPMTWIESVMLGFIDNGGNQPFQARGALMRVAGSTFHPIELGVVSAMLLPLSVWRALYDRQGWKPLHWLGTLLLVFSVVATVSRSGIIGLVIAALIVTPFLPKLAQQWGLIVIPVVVAGLFVGIPGLVSTIFGSFVAGSSDPSISTRLNNFPRVLEMVSARPLTGTGPGTYMPTNALLLLDNEYFLTAVNMGVPGLVAIIIYLAVPGAFTLIAANFAVDTQLRLLAGAVAAGCLVAAAASATFDSLSFPVFALLYPFFIGLGGSVWLLVKRESVARPALPASWRVADNFRRK